MADKKTTGDAGSIADDAAERIRQLNEQVIEAARAGGTAYLEAYENALKSIADYQQGLAEASPVDWITRVVEAQATFTREVGRFYASAARDFLK
jgi:hypothetical protein